MPKANLSSLLDPLILNVWDIEAKAIIFTGNRSQCANYLKLTRPAVSQALKLKSRISKGKYCVRVSKSPIALHNDAVSDTSKV